MKKGSMVLSKPLMAVVSMILFVVVLLYMQASLSKLLSNPCWKETLDGLEPFKKDNNKDPTLVLNPECVSKAVFTTKSVVCKLICSEDDDMEQVRICSSKCETNSSEPNTFIIVSPLNDEGLLGGLGKRLAKSVSNRDIMWAFNGKTDVFTIPCDVREITGIPECIKNGDSWECTPTPGKDAESYFLDVTRTGTFCTVEGLKYAKTADT